MFEGVHRVRHLVLQLFEHERDRLAVEVPGWGGHGGVDVGVGVDPNQTQVRTLLGVARNRADGQAAKGETGTLALLSYEVMDDD